MNWSSWSRLFSRLRRSPGRSGPRYDRRLAIVVENSSHTDDVVLDLSAARADSALLISLTALETESGKHAGGAIAGAEPDTGRSWRAFYQVPGHRKGRVRTWSLDEVIADGPGDGPLLLADIALVPIAVDRLLDPPADLARALDAIHGCLLSAKRLGRLRRVAILLTGDPGQVPLRHPSQARMPEFREGSLRDELGRELLRWAETPGHPLADRAWNEFLRRQVAAFPAFVSFVDGVRQLLPGRSTLHFVRQGEGGSPGLDQLLEWIDRSRFSSDASAHRGARRMLRGAAAILVLAAAVSLVLPPSWIGEPARAAVDSTQAAHREFDALAARYDTPGALPDVWLGDKSAREEVLHARAVLADQLALGAVRDTLEARVARATADRLEASDRERRRERAERIDREIAVTERLLLPALDLSAERTEGRSDRGRVELRTTLARARTASALLRLEPLNGGFDGFSLDSAESTRLVEAWRRVGDERVGRSLLSVMAAKSASEFYRAFRRLALGGRTGAVGLSSLDPAVPRLRQVDALAARRPAEYATLGREEFSGFVRPAGPGEEPGPPRTMVVRFTNPGDGIWHVDVARPGGRFIAARWVSGGSPADGCQIQLPNANVGEVLQIGYCGVSRDHMLLAGKRNDASVGIRELVLDEPTGEVRIPGGVVLNYEVTNGWPSSNRSAEEVKP